jgi:peptide chain release factor 1
VADAVAALAKVRAEQAELEAMASAGDAEMAALARDELEALKERLPELEREVALLLAPRDADENASAILEVRAGTGGDEAALFAGDLFRMYQRYAANRGWKVEIDSISEGEAGGYKEIVASVTGDGVFGRLKFESGVHRVQRVPATEAGGASTPRPPPSRSCPRSRTSRSTSGRKTSASTPIRSSGPGGQHVNKTDSAVRITHLPTGIVVTSLGEVAAREPRQGDEEPEGQASTTCSAARLSTRPARTRARARSARATAPSASAPTTSRKAASPTTAST